MILLFNITTEDGIFSTTKSVMDWVGEQVLEKQPYENSDILVDVKKLSDEEEIEWIKYNKRDAEDFSNELRKIIVYQDLRGD